MDAILSLIDNVNADRQDLDSETVTVVFEDDSEYKIEDDWTSKICQAVRDNPYGKDVKRVDISDSVEGKEATLASLKNSLTNYCTIIKNCPVEVEMDRGGEIVSAMVEDHVAYALDNQ